MNRQLGCFRAAVLAGIIGSSVAKADAQPTTERVLVVGVSKGHGSDTRLVKGLGEHLQQSGMLLAEDTLSTQDRACESPDCMEDLAKRADAQLILTAQLQQNAPGSIFITMALLDVVRHAPFQETALCDQCNQDALIGKLSDVADKLIKQSREARQAPVSSTQPPSVPSVPLVSDSSGGGNYGVTNGGQPPKVAQGYFAKLSQTRKIAAGVLGGVGVATFATSIALAATNRQRTSLGCTLNANVVSDYCELNNTTLFGTGFALTGALAISLGLTLFWPANSSTSSSVGSR